MKWQELRQSANVVFQVGGEDAELGVMAFNYSLPDGDLAEILPVHLNEACLVAGILESTPIPFGIPNEYPPPYGPALNDAESSGSVSPDNPLPLPDPSIVFMMLSGLAAQCETLKEKFSLYAAQHHMVMEEQEFETPSFVQRILSAPPMYTGYMARLGGN